MGSSTVHYENSNGFVPLIVSKQPHQAKKTDDFNKSGTSSFETEKLSSEEHNSRRTKNEKLSDNPVNVKNRRSFRVHDSLQDNQEEFEILKVNNGTPAVADYNAFYDHLRSSSVNTNTSQTPKKHSRIKNRERGKRIQNYLGSYDTASDFKVQNLRNENEKKFPHHQESGQTNFKADNSAAHLAQSPSLTKTSYHEKTFSQHQDSVQNNYKANNAEINNSQSSSLPKTNFHENTSTHFQYSVQNNFKTDNSRINNSQNPSSPKTNNNEKTFAQYYQPSVQNNHKTNNSEINNSQNPALPKTNNNEKTFSHYQQSVQNNYKINNSGINSSQNPSLPKSNYNEKTLAYYQQSVQNNYKTDNLANHHLQGPSLVNDNYISSTTIKPINLKRNEEHKFKMPIINVQSSDKKADLKVSAQNIPQPVIVTNLSNTPGVFKSEQYFKQESNSRHYDSADSRDYSGENFDYLDEADKPRRAPKATSRRRPHRFESSKKLPKEHRDSYDDIYDDNGRKYPSSKTKSAYRQKPKVTQFINEDYDNGSGNVDENTSSSNNRDRENNGWNQLTPNVEVSHSNGFELNQIEKPKIHIVPVNILHSFDHATALDNSQGFDITNAMITGFVPDGSIVSTVSPLISSSSNKANGNSPSSSTAKPSLRVSTSVPDVIVGQSSFQNPVQAVLFPNKMQQNMLNSFVQSTVAPPIFAVTSQQNYMSSSTLSPSLQQLLNQVQGSFPMNQNLMMPQASPFINSNEQQEKNTNYLPFTQSTTSRSSYRTQSHQKKKLNGNDGEFLASASLSVGQGHQRYSNKKENRYSKKNNKNVNDFNGENQYNNQDAVGHTLNTYVQPTVVPAILHTGIGFINNQPFVPNSLLITNSQPNTEMLQATKEALENSIKQLQLNLQNSRYQTGNIATSADNVGGASNNVNALNNLMNSMQKAQLPIVGAKNVEIINPNLNANAYAIQPAALVTTPIPIFTTTSFIASKQPFSSPFPDSSVSIQSIVDSLTEIGSKPSRKKAKVNINSFNNLQIPDTQLYNPINFVPNYDLMKSQTILNTNVATNAPISQQNLNLVSFVPGGNFYKHSQGAQIDLTTKPKLSSDLEKYAEEMFKESLRTIYNSHKWNHDYGRAPINISLVDTAELAKLRKELLRIKQNYRGSKVPKDVLEAHQTEQKIRTSKPGKGAKRPDASFEQYYKKPQKGGVGGTHHHSANSEILDFLTPPKVNSFISKSPFNDKPHNKKRPGSGPRLNANHDSNSKIRPRQSIVTLKPKGVESQASGLVHYRYPIRVYPEKKFFSQSDFTPTQFYNNYPSFTTSAPRNNQFKASVEYKSSETDYLDMNNQRMHNLMGLLMKNKQLPAGIQVNNYQNSGSTFGQSNSEEVNPPQFSQFNNYQDNFRGFQKKSDFEPLSIPLDRNAENNSTKV